MDADPGFAGRTWPSHLPASSALSRPRHIAIPSPSWWRRVWSNEGARAGHGVPATARPLNRIRPESGQFRPPCCRGRVTLCGIARQSPTAGTTAIGSNRMSGRSWPNPCKLLKKPNHPDTRHEFRRSSDSFQGKLAVRLISSPFTTRAQRVNRPIPARPTPAGSQKVAGGRAQRPPPEHAPNNASTPKGVPENVGQHERDGHKPTHPSRPSNNRYSDKVPQAVGLF